MTCFSMSLLDIALPDTWSIPTVLQPASTPDTVSPLLLEAGSFQLATHILQWEFRRDSGNKIIRSIIMAKFSIAILTAAPAGQAAEAGGAFVKIDGREALLRSVELFLNRDAVVQIQLMVL